MKGIILAGGSGTRLYPLTMKTSKQLLPVYDKPMIFYPLSTLRNAGIRDILIVTAQESLSAFKELLGDGSNYEVNLSYKAQKSPEGLAQALLLGEDFVGQEPCAVILGDNIFYGESFDEMLKEAAANCTQGKATVFGYYVEDPERFGVLEFDADGRVISIEEKPQNPKSNYCITGLYFYDNRVMDFAKKVIPSERGELEITDVNRFYLEDGSLNVRLLDQSVVWMDVGTMESLTEASEFIRTIVKGDCK